MSDETRLPEERSIAKETLKRVKLTEVWLVILTGVIAASSVTTCYVYSRQLDVMQDTLNEIRTGGIDTHSLARASSKQATALTDSIGPATTSAAKAAETSAKNSDRIARGSEAAVGATQASMRLDQRAWIGFKGFRDLHLEIGKPPSVTIVFVNTGKTPAVGARISSYIEYVPPHNSPSQQAPGSIDEASNAIIHPGQETWSVLNKSDFLLTSAIADAIALRTGNLYVRTVITYDDIFAKHHATHYCGIASRDLTSIGSCANGNYSD